jgi:1,4-alpha-glucan branching enzyme
MTKKIVKTRRVQFEYNNKEASSVFLVGDFNAWDRKKHEMKKNDDGTYRKTLMLSPKPYEYKFLVDGQWKKDPLNKMFSFNCFRKWNNVIYVH